MATAVKRNLSGSADGEPIKVVATGSPGTTIHTAVAGTTPGTCDEIWLFLYNTKTSAVVVHIEVGGSDLPMVLTLAPQAGLVPVRPGMPLQNGKVIKIYADTANVVGVEGFANRITD